MHLPIKLSKPPLVIITILLALLLLTIFFIIALGPLHNLDRSIFLSVTGWRNLWLDQVMTFVTMLGGLILGGIIFFLCLYFLKKRQWEYFLLFIVAGIATYFLKVVLKAAFDRPRPNLVVALVEEHSASFPSGHALFAFVFYGLIAWLIIQKKSSQNIKIIVILLAVVLILAVGISRVYLGVHWPSDVLAGYFVGGCSLYALLFAQKNLIKSTRTGA